MSDRIDPIIAGVLRTQRVTTFKQEIEKMIATNKAALVKSNQREPAINRFRRDYTKEDIHRILTCGTAADKAMLSEYFFRISGIYKRIILHYATFLTYSWVLVPHMKKYTDKLSEKKNKQTYFDAAEFCSIFGIERKCDLFATKVLVYGAYYGIIHDSGSSIAIQDLPFEYCRSRFKNHQDVDIIEFNVKFFDDKIKEEDLKKEILKTYPKVIQKGYRDYKNGKDPWIFIPAEIGIYFTLFEEQPFFLDLIPLIDDLEDYKALDKQRKQLSLKRIITQEMPIYQDDIIFTPDEAAEMHEGIVDMLADNPDTDVVTSFGKVDLLNLSGNEAFNTSDVEQAQDLIYESAGASKELFSATTDSGLEFSLNNDLSMMMILGYGFAHFFTALLNNKFGTKKLSFKLIILPVSFYNSYEYTSKAKDLAAFGYSFLTPVLSTGIDQTDLADLKSLENDVLNLDEYLKPLQSAYTQSGKTNAITAQTAKVAEKQNQNDSTTAKKDETEKQKSASQSNAGTSSSAEKKSDGGEDK